MPLSKLKNTFTYTYKKYIEPITKIAEDGNKVFITNSNEEFNFDKFSHDELKRPQPDCVVDTVIPMTVRNKLHLVEFKNLPIEDISYSNIESKLSDSLTIIKTSFGLNNTDTSELNGKLYCHLFYNKNKKGRTKRSKGYSLNDIKFDGKKLNVQPSEYFNEWYNKLPTS